MSGIFNIILRKLVGLAILCVLISTVWLSYANRESLAGILPKSWTQSAPAKQLQNTPAEIESGDSTLSGQSGGAGSTDAGSVGAEEMAPAPTSTEAVNQDSNTPSTGGESQ